MVAEMNPVATSQRLVEPPKPIEVRSDWRTSSGPTAIIDFGVGRIFQIPSAAVVVSDDWISYGVNKVRALAVDWDGYGADPIKEKTIKQMEWILRNDVPLDGEAGAIVPGADGSLQAEWHLKDFELGLVVEADSSISSWVRPRDGSEIEKHGLQARELFWSVANVALA